MISIVIPAHNAEPYLLNRVKEICGGAHSIPDEIQIVIVDDGSTDGTGGLFHPISEMVTEYDVLLQTIHHFENRGTFEAERSGVNAATGEYVYFHDADDPFNPALLAELFELRAIFPANVHIAAPTRVFLDGVISANLWHTATGPAIDALEEQFRGGRGAITRRSLFRRDILLPSYKDLSAVLAETETGQINAIQDTFVITYMIGTGVFDSIVETHAEYWYTGDTEASMSHNTNRRLHDIPILRGVTAFALDTVCGSGGEHTLAEYINKFRIHDKVNDEP